MPQTESRSSKSLKTLRSTIEGDAFNPFSDKYESNHQHHHHHKSKKLSPKVPKKTGKCFQLILICQKLLKPFSSSHKMCDSSGSKKISQNHKEKSKSTPQINIDERLKVHRAIVPVEKVDASVQTNIPSISDCKHLSTSNAIDSATESPYFLKEEEIRTEDYWDLDIDSAIVGDYNSVSEMSLDDQIDPHYAKIKLPNDDRAEPKYDCLADTSTFNVSQSDRLNSNASSPKSGIYSKINKSRKKDDNKKHKSNSKLNLEHIMMIKNQLGLSHEMYAFDDDTKMSFPSAGEFQFYPPFIHTNETPDLPKRNYGSSVINFITKLREEKDSSHSFNTQVKTKSSLTMNFDDVSKQNNIYSPIWYMKRRISQNVSHHEDTPASEPTIPKRSSKSLLDNLNPNFRDDSSEEASSISFYSPLKNKYSYPRNFSENHSIKQYLEHQYESLDRGILVDEMRMLRHVDSEVDLSVSHTSAGKTDHCVPLEYKFDDLCFAMEDKLFLEPLMERSYEEDYFRRDMSSSLEYINV